MDLDDQELIATRDGNVNKKVCKNCKYYSKGEFTKFYGNCSNPKFEYEIASFYEKYHKGPKFKDKLFYMDYEGYSADFEVGEEFGCIHFEKI